MNLVKDRQKVLDALVEVEGKDWLRRQKAGQFKGYSVFEAIKALKTGFVKDSTRGFFVIYGDDGWNRYRVTAGGEVQFIELQAGRAGDIEKAKKAGFEIV